MMKRFVRSFVLAEILLAAIIVAVAASAIALPFAAGVKNVQDSARLEQAVELAESLMDEVANRPFEDPQSPGSRQLGPEAGETSRALFDNVDDYNGYAESDLVLRERRNGLLVVIAPSNASGLWRSVSVQYVTLTGQPSTDQNAALVTVTVNDGSNGAIYTLSRIVVREY